MVGKIRPKSAVNFLRQESKKENGQFGKHWPKWTVKQNFLEKFRKFQLALRQRSGALQRQKSR
jgi:hypothetical protein